jgi:ketosteroid isomerase-like protein
MADHPNVELLRNGYAAFAEGNLAAVSDLFSDDIVWHVPGNNDLAGDHQGKDQVLAAFGKLFEMTGGTFRNDEIHDVVANDEHGVVLVKSSGRRPDGRAWSGRSAHIWHMADGKATEFWIFNEDQATVDAFFS